jgi:hypothetical protein
MLKIKMKRMVTAIVIVAVALIAIKFIMFPPVKEIPTTGKYNYTSEDYWVTENKVDPYSGRERTGSFRSGNGIRPIAPSRSRSSWRPTDPAGQ